MELSTLLLIGVINLIVIVACTMSGGVGLIMRPIMIFLGVPPDITIGTARASAVPGSIAAQAVLHKSQKIDWHLVKLLVAPNLIGGLFGIFVIISVSDIVLKKIIGAMMLIAGIILIFKKKIGIKKTKAWLKKRTHLFYSAPVMLIAGSLLVLVGGMGVLTRFWYIVGYGKTHIEAAAIMKAINFWQTFITAFIFIYLSLINWALLLVLATTSLIGSYLGTHYVLKKGENYLRILIIVVIFASGIKLLFF